MSELREELEAAWEESETEGTDEIEAQEEKGETAAPELEQDEPIENAPIVAKDPAEKVPLVEGETPTKEVAAVKESKAPASWSPTARESWGKVPAAAQAQIAKREAEVNQVLQQSSEARKAAQSLNSVLAPHREGLQAAGYNDPFQAISTLFQAESGLRTGSTHDKAQGIANLIKHYGVDITSLDNILSGTQHQQQSNPNTEMQDMMDERMAPFNQYMAQQQQQQQYGVMQQQQEANSQVAEFGAGKEFMDDVRMDMANIMDAASGRGEVMDMEQAYTIACQIHPDVSSVIKQRQNQQNIMGTNKNATQKRAASVSLTGTQGGAGGDNENLSLRDQITEAWNSQVG
jgi:hypothetical protein